MVFSLIRQKHSCSDTQSGAELRLVRGVGVTIIPRFV